MVSDARVNHIFVFLIPDTELTHYLSCVKYLLFRIRLAVMSVYYMVLCTLVHGKHLHFCRLETKVLCTLVQLWKFGKVENTLYVTCMGLLQLCA